MCFIEIVAVGQEGGKICLKNMVSHNHRHNNKKRARAKESTFHFGAASPEIAWRPGSISEPLTLVFQSSPGCH